MGTSRLRCFVQLSILTLVALLARPHSSAGADLLPPLKPEGAPAGTQPAAPATQAERKRIQSAVVGADRRVTFRLEAPKATVVSVAGIIGKFPMTRGTDGIWTVTTEPMEPELYEYHYNVDGLNLLDPANPYIKSQTDNLVEVPAAKLTLYDQRPVAHGSVRIHWYVSTVLKVNRRMHVYLPPGYDSAKSATYPVLYLLHGSGDDDAGWMTTGRANFIFDNLLAEGKMVPMIVVMPNGHTPANPGPGPATASANAPDAFGDFQHDLFDDVMSFIEANYRVHADAQHRAVAGLSMGGGQSLRLALANPDRFAYVALMSQGFKGMDNLDKAFPGFPADASSIGSHFKLFWIGCGKKDKLLKFSQQLDQWLTAHKVAHQFEESEGAHEWHVWRNNLIELTPRLFKAE